MKKKTIKFVYQIMTPPPPFLPSPQTHTKWAKLRGFVDFKMAANENALTQPKFELGIYGIIHNVFQADQTTKQIFKRVVGKKIIIFHGNGGGTPPWKIP